jgi:hypothetical protein
MIGKGAFIASKVFAKKHYTNAIQSIKELKGPIGKINTKVYKHVTKHPVKYAAGAAAVGGFGLAKIHSSQEKKLKTYFGKLPKSDPRYKSLKKKGYL